MKSLRWMFLFVLLVGVAIAQGGPGKGKGAAGMQSGDVKSNILSMEKEWREATLKNDPSLLEKYAAADYHSIAAYDGQAHAKAELVAMMKSGKAKYSDIAIENEDVQVVGPGLAIFHGVASVKMNINGKDQSGRYHVSRVWHRMRGGDWKAVWFQTTKMP